MRIEFHREFRRNLYKLPDSIQSKVHERLRMFEANKFAPLLNNHSVKKTYPGCRSINVTGDYRAIFYEAGDLVMFVNIGTHSELYG